MNKILKADPIIFICTLILLAIGIFTLYSLTGTNIEEQKNFFEIEFVNQLVYGFIGIIFALIVFFIPIYYFKLKWILILIYTFTIILLLYTIFFGLDIKGVKRWISVGGQILENGSISGGLTIQPSEFAKLTIIIITAFLMSVPTDSEERKISLLNRIKQYFYQNQYTFYALFSGLGIIILTLAQKSLSVAIITMIIFFSIFFGAIKNKIRFVLPLISFVLSLLTSQNIFFNLDIVTKLIIFLVPLAIYIFSVFSEKINDITIFITILFGILSGAFVVDFIWNDILEVYQRQRIESYFNPNRNLENEGFQQNQSIISIGAGKIFGQGLTQVDDNRLSLLPEPTTDFIFAVFCYKFGFVGALILLCIYIILITRIFQLSDQMNDKFSSLILIGVATMIMVQFFFNIGMNLGILPVGGTTLPFISAGGSSLVSMLVGIGLVENFVASNRMEKNIHSRQDKILIQGWNI